jgi:hypothetical protein
MFVGVNLRMTESEMAGCFMLVRVPIFGRMRWLTLEALIKNQRKNGFIR